MSRTLGLALLMVLSSTSAFATCADFSGNFIDDRTGSTYTQIQTGCEALQMIVTNARGRNDVFTIYFNDQWQTLTYSTRSGSFESRSVLGQFFWYQKVRNQTGLPADYAGEAVYWIDPADQNESVQFLSTLGTDSYKIRRLP